MPDRIDVHVRLDSVPKTVESAVEKLANPVPSSGAKTFFKDYLPAVTPIAAIVVTITFSYATCEFNRRSAANAFIDTYGRIIGEVGLETDPTKKTTAALKLAAYGDQALPAVKIALGAADPSIRKAGVRVAQQMYRLHTVAHAKLTTDILAYYDDDTLRLGVVEWLEAMKQDLSHDDSRLAFGKLKQTFGDKGQFCGQQPPEIQVASANFFHYWKFFDSTDLALGMVADCTDEGARRAATIALTEIAKDLSVTKRQSIRDRLLSLTALSPELQSFINIEANSIEVQ